MTLWEEDPTVQTLQNTCNACNTGFRNLVVWIQIFCNPSHASFINVLVWFKALATHATPVFEIFKFRYKPFATHDTLFLENLYFEMDNKGSQSSNCSNWPLADLLQLFWIQNSWNPCHTYLRNLVWIETFCNSCTLNLEIFKFEMIWTQTREERSNSSSDIYGISACNMGS